MNRMTLSPPTLRFLLSLMIVATLIRGGVIVWRFDHLQSDPDAYRLLAENLSTSEVFGNVDAAGKSMPTAFRPPGYPWLLSWLVVDGQLKSVSVAVLHLILGLATIWMTYRVGCRLVSPTSGLAAAILLAIDPILLAQSTLVMTETIATFVAVLAWWLFIRNDSISVRDSSFKVTACWSLALGCTLAAGYLCRPVFIVWTALMVAMLAVIAAFQSRRALLTAMLVLLVMGFVVGGWTWRNVQAMGKPIWATTHGGYTLLLGNNPSFYKYLSEARFGEKWDAEFFHQRWAQRRRGDPRVANFWTAESLDASEPKPSLNEIQDDRLAYETAKATIQRQPNMFVASCFVRLGRLWSPMPHAGDHPNMLRVAIGGYYVALYTACLIGLWQVGHRLLSPTWMSMLLLAITLSCVHSIYWSNMRMRALATPLLVVLAASSAGCKPGRQTGYGPKR